MNQVETVIDYLEKNKSITSKDAIGLGITRLSAVIFKIKDKYPELGVKTKSEKVETRYGVTNIARYYLEE